MRDFVGRMLDEATELNSKLAFLKEFISSKKYNELSREEKDMLLDQRDAMDAYSKILQKRIDYYKDKV